MNIVILTSVSKGYASLCLEKLNKGKKLNIKGVIFSKNQIQNSKNFYKNKLNKIFKIGILGSLNGIRIRSWFNIPSVESNIFSLCKKNGINIYIVDSLNTKSARDILKILNPDLGISLGNGYISKKTYETPKYGMINVHTEVLPKYKGAHSVIWPIYFNEQTTGFTIHQIDSKIDNGNILLKHHVSIKFGKRIKDTIRNTLHDISQILPDQLLKVCENYDYYFHKSHKQTSSRSFTTPSFKQFLKMKKNNKTLYRQKIN